MPTLVAIYASTSGHTEFVISEISATLNRLLPDLKVECIRAERALAGDFERADILLLGSGTWNANGVEGQLNPHMDTLLNEALTAADLKGKPCAVASLGDDRYRFTARATEHLIKFITNHHGKSLLPPLVIVNEPYGQTDRISRWTEKLAGSIKSLKEWAAFLS